MSVSLLLPIQVLWNYKETLHNCTFCHHVSSDCARNQPASFPHTTTSPPSNMNLYNITCMIHEWFLSGSSMTKLQTTSYRITSKPLCSNIILWPRLILVNNDLHYVNLLLLFKSQWYCVPQYPVFPMNVCSELWGNRSRPKINYVSHGYYVQIKLTFSWELLW